MNTASKNKRHTTGEPQTSHETQDEDAMTMTRAADYHSNQNDRTQGNLNSELAAMDHKNGNHTDTEKRLSTMAL